MDGLLSWWDGVELWLSGLDFVWQTLVVMPVVLVLAYGIALVLDAALGNTIRVTNWVTAEVRSRATHDASDIEDEKRATCRDHE